MNDKAQYDVVVVGGGIAGMIAADRAAPMCAGITYTMGGISVNEHAQALRADGSFIAGLYALGSATGGLEGGPEIGYVGGLAKGGVTALVSAEHVAASIGQKLQ